VIVPPVDASRTDQLTAVSLALPTNATKLCVPPLASATDLGEIVTLPATTVTVAESLAFDLTALVATTWYVPGTEGAVYVPAGVIEPPSGSCNDQVTDWAPPLTAAAKDCVRPTLTVAVFGVTEIMLARVPCCVLQETSRAR
jgi:hypothetical protein